MGLINNIAASAVWMARRIMPDVGRHFSRVIRRRRLPVAVNSDTALTVSTVWGCINFITGQIMLPPWDVFKKTKKGPEKYDDHPSYWLLSRRANPEMSAVNFRELMMYRLLLFGNFYAEIERDRAGRAIALWPIDNPRVNPHRDPETAALVYTVTNTDGKVDIPPKDMFHVSGLGFDGICGYSVIEFAARTLGLTIAAEEYGSSFFGNSGVPSSVLQHPKNIGKGAKARLEAFWATNKRGVLDSQDTLLLEEGMEYKVIGLPPEQAQFLETRRFTVEDVCRWFRVPPSKIGHFEKISYNSAEQLSLDVITECLLPWIKKMEQEADFKLLGDNFGGIYTKLDLRSLMRATHVDRSRYYKDLFSIGVFSINDILALEDMPSIPNGDIHLVPLNMANLKDVVQGKLEPGGGKTTDAGKGQEAGPNPPKPPKFDATDEDLVRRGRLLALLDTTLDEAGINEQPAQGNGNGSRAIN